MNPVDLAVAIPAGGVFGALVWVICHLLKSNRDDRQDYRAAVVEARKEADDERTRADQERARADREREQRMQVEDTLSAEIRALKDQVARLQATVDQMRDQSGILGGTA